MTSIKIHVFSNFVKIEPLTEHCYSTVQNFCFVFNQFGYVRDQYGRFRYEVVRRYYIKDKRTVSFKIHVNAFGDLLFYLKDHGIPHGEIDVTYEPMYEPEKIDLAIQPGWVLRDYQIPVKDFIVRDFIVNDKTANMRMVNLKTGRGKTFIAINALVELGERIALVIKPSYIDKWIEDFLKITTVDKKDLMVVQGGKQLKAILELAIDNKLTSKVIIFSNKTLQIWLKSFTKSYDEALEEWYGVEPSSFFKLLKVGTRLIDEVHQDFHFNFMLDLNTHVKRVVSLSATLQTRDAFIMKMYDTAYPKPLQYREKDVPKYIHAYAVSYPVRGDVVLETTERNSRMYSHHAFERSVIKNKLFTTYLEMIKSMIDFTFLKDYVKGDKLAVFASGVNVCSMITTYLTETYPQFSVKRYVKDDPYENIIEPDIRVTTVLSGGTAIDIPGLTVVIQTIAIDSIQANLQTMGRLRNIPDRIVKFLYIVCQDVPKHIEYNERRKDLLVDEVLTFKEVGFSRGISPVYRERFKHKE